MRANVREDPFAIGWFRVFLDGEDVTDRTVGFDTDPLGPFVDLVDPDSPGSWIAKFGKVDVYLRSDTMATGDVPGANPANADTLHVGCWAEHEDGSLIFVAGTEGGMVVYSMFDLSVDPPIEYRDAMQEAGFKAQFSWPNKDNVRWTWHDKTPMPWDRIMTDFPAGPRQADAGGQLSAAARVAQSLSLRAEKVRDREELRPTGTPTARGVAQRFKDALGEFAR